MTSNPIGIVICRIGAIWAVIVGIGGVGLEFATLLNSPSAADSVSAYSIVMILIYFVLAFVLWHYAESISSTRFPTPDRSTVGSFDSSELVMIGVHLLGIYILVMAVINIFQTETLTWLEYYGDSSSESFVEMMSARAVSMRVSNAVQAILGIALIIRGKKGLR